MEIWRSTTEEDNGAALHGDILELVLSRVPLIHLIPASRVSTSWKLTVSSALLHLSPPKPWLFVHTQSTRPPYTVATRAYDPRSRVWVELQVPPASVKHASTALRSSHSNLLYKLSPSHLSVSTDPLHLTWHHACAPLVWRADPIVAAVGHRVVVAGGGCDFDEEPLAVEIYDLRTCAWESFDEMPSALRDCSASKCLSVAVNGVEIYVSEKASGVTHSFDPESKTWRGPYDLRPDRDIYFSVIEFVNESLILVGLVDESTGKGKSVKIWKVRGEISEFTELAEMPPELVKELKGENSCIPSIGVCSARDFLYIYNPAKPEVVLWCDLAGGGDGCEWGIVRNRAVDGQSRAVFSCSNVGIHELESATEFGNWKLSEDRDN